MFQTPDLDLELFRLINQVWRNDFFNIIMPILSSMTVLFGLVAFITVIQCKRHGIKRLTYILFILAALGLTDFGTNIVKKQIGRVRPLNALEHTWRIESGQWYQMPADFQQTKERGTSYPSAHAANTACLAVLLILLWPRLKGWPLLLPLLTGYSRSYLGKHYPSDVVAGWIFGFIVAAFVWYLWKFLAPRFGIHIQPEN